MNYAFLGDNNTCIYVVDASGVVYHGSYASVGRPVSPTLILSSLQALIAQLQLLRSKELIRKLPQNRYESVIRVASLAYVYRRQFHPRDSGVELTVKLFENDQTHVT